MHDTLGFLYEISYLHVFSILVQEKWDEITEDIETVFGRGDEADNAK